MKAPSLVIAVPKGKGEDEMDDESMMDKESEDDSDFTENADAVAEMCGVPEEKRADFAEAMRALVKSC